MINKILISLLIILSIGTIGFVIYKQNKILKNQESIEKSIVLQKEISENILRSMDIYVSKKDLEVFAKENNLNLDAIKKDLEKLDANVKGINKITVVSNGINNSNIPSTETIINTNPNPTSVDTYGYLKNSQILKLNEDFSNIQIPIGEVKFEAWKEKPWSENILSRQYNVITVVGIDEDNRQYTYNKFSIKINNKSYDIKINNSTFLQEFPVEKFFWWNPKFFLGISAGINISDTSFNLSPGIYFSAFSYGKTKTTPSWSFLQFGPSYNLNNKAIGASLSPFMYNLGNNISFIKNTYAGPSISIDLDKKFSLLGTMSVNF